jgi:hypothetical protein
MLASEIGTQKPRIEDAITYGTRTKVSPATSEGINGADNFLGKKATCPILAHDEGSTGDTDKKAQDIQAGCRLDESCTSRRDGSSTKNDRKEYPCAVDVAKRPKNKPHQNGPADTCNGRSPHFLLGQVKIVTDLREERRDGEPNKEGDQEGPPRAVEGSHVRSSKAAK